MSYRVRTPDGQLEFASLYEIAKALRHGLVHGEDEILSPGQESWVRVSEHTALRTEIPTARQNRPRIPGGFDLVGTVVFALTGLVGIFLGWSAWVVYAAVGAAVWFSTRVALGVHAANRVKSRRR
ncbi:MAG TPA: hypothetical protein VFF12_00125 [Myxococcaceae bacterium]|nr:hypothetical protein [Myxococcaceae bacterium]